jgi:hypothetical protein
MQMWQHFHGRFDVLSEVRSEKTGGEGKRQGEKKEH